jgi:hypothetical protein
METNINNISPSNTQHWCNSALHIQPNPVSLPHTSRHCHCQFCTYPLLHTGASKHYASHSRGKVALQRPTNIKMTLAENNKQQCHGRTPHNRTDLVPGLAAVQVVTKSGTEYVLPAISRRAVANALTTTRSRSFVRCFWAVWSHGFLIVVHSPFLGVGIELDCCSSTGSF